MYIAKIKSLFDLHHRLLKNSDYSLENFKCKHMQKKRKILIYPVGGQLWRTIWFLKSD